MASAEQILQAQRARIEEANRIRAEKGISAIEALKQAGAPISEERVEQARRQREAAKPPTAQGQPPGGIEAEAFITESTKPPTNIPSGAKAIEYDAKGNPTVYQHGNEKYFAPGSTPYETGFRTEKEYRQAQSRGASTGLHEGQLIPEGTIVKLYPGGEPSARYTETQLKDVDKEFLEKGDYRISTKDYRGKEVLLTPKQAEKLSTADNLSEQLSLAKQYKLVPQDATLKEFTMAPGEAKRMVAAGEFIGGQESKRYQAELNRFETQLKKDSPELYRVYKDKGYDAYSQEVDRLKGGYERSQLAVSMLGKYTDKEGAVDGAKWLRDTKDKTTLANAGFNDEQVKEWEKWNRANLFPLYQGSVKEKRNELLKTVKLTTGEGPEQYYTRVDGLARAEVLKGYNQTDKNSIMTAQVIDVASFVVPGVDTAYRWGILTTKDKAIAVTTDVAMVLVMLSGGRVLGAVGKRLAGVTKTLKMARAAGKAAKELKTARKGLDKIIVNPKAEAVAQRLAHNAATDTLETARGASMKADRIFFAQLEKIEVLSPGDLGKLERASGIKGLRQGITDITKAKNEVGKAWKEVDKLGKLRGKSILDDKQYLQALADLQTKQARLELARLKAESVLQVRFKYTEPPAEFKGVRIDIKKNKPKFDLRGMQDEVDTWLAKNRPPVTSGGKTGIQTITKTRIKQVPDIAIPKAIYAKPEVKPGLKITPPRVEVTRSLFPGIKVKPAAKVEYKPKGAEPQTERIWTQAQREKYFSQEQQAVRSQSLNKELQRLESLGQFNPKNWEWQQINEALRAGEEAGVEAMAKGLTKEEISEKTAEAVATKLKAVAKPQTGTQRQIKTVTRAITRTITKVVTTTIPEIPKVPRVPLKPFLPLSGASKEKKWTPEEIKTAIAWKDGFVIHALKSPYRRGIDEDSFNVNNIPTGLTVMRSFSGKGSQQASVRINGKLKRQVTVDVGNQDVIITPRSGGRRVTLRHVRDTRGTTSQTTIKKRPFSSLSKKHGRVFHTNVGGGTILSRRRIGGY